MLQKEPWAALWFFLAQLLLVAWAYRPSWMFFKFDLRGYWQGPHGWLKTRMAGTVGFIATASAWLGFYVVLATGYRASLTFVSASSYEDWLSPRDMICAVLSFAGATAIVWLLVAHEGKRRTRYLNEKLERLLANPRPGE